MTRLTDAVRNQVQPTQPDAPRSLAATPADSSAPFLRIDRVSKRFADFNALSDVSLDVEEGEFVCFLGPSGCGKSTLLRIIVGLERQSAGRILSLGLDLSSATPAARHFGILFQSYALFPNLTVRNNVAYGLHNRRAGRAEIDRRVAELLDLVGLAGTEAKFPAQLSGGQQQRVALARAIAPSPRLLLLDEPLSALDAQVRVHLRRQIRAIQKQLGLTTIMVTHDQQEALTLADRVMVMRDGTVEQIGTPTQIYHTPATAFVAGFVGEMNFLNASVQDGIARVGQTALTLRQPAPRQAGNIRVGIRPECVRISRGNDPGGNRISATVKRVEFLGSVWRITAFAPSLAMDLTVDCSEGGAPSSLEPGAWVHLALPPEHLALFAEPS